jgi:hypothetical protein
MTLLDEAREFVSDGRNASIYSDPINNIADYASRFAASQLEAKEKQIAELARVNAQLTKVLEGQGAEFGADGTVISMPLTDPSLEWYRTKFISVCDEVVSQLPEPEPSDIPAQWDRYLIQIIRDYARLKEEVAKRDEMLAEADSINCYEWLLTHNAVDKTWAAHKTNVETHGMDVSGPFNSALEAFSSLKSESE